MGARTRFGGGVSRPMTRVRFWLNWHVEYGQAIRVVGSHENLGELPFNRPQLCKQGRYPR